MLKLLLSFIMAGVSLYLVTLIPGVAFDLDFLKNPLTIVFPLFTVPGLITGWFGADWWFTAIFIAAVLQLIVIGWTVRIYFWIKKAFQQGGQK